MSNAAKQNGAGVVVTGDGRRTIIGGYKPKPGTEGIKPTPPAKDSPQK